MEQTPPTPTPPQPNNNNIEADKAKAKELVNLISQLREQKSFDAAKQLEDSLKKKYPHLMEDLGIVSNTTETWLDKFITVDPEMIKMKERVRKLSTVDDNVLILGESGTGKELIARALHGSRTGKFIPINCTSLPDYLLESELFGHVKGSFTGADKDKIGLFQAAALGTVFLDEIGDMPMTLQAKLLRVLQDKKIRRVGGNEEISIESVRFVFATNQNLNDKDKFRLDLLARIGVFEIKTKPIRDRLNDIGKIVASLEPKYARELELMILREVEEDIKNMFIPLYMNVRSIQAAVRRWQVLGEA